MPDSTFCERCDMHNCEHVTGAGRRFDESISEVHNYFQGYPDRPQREQSDRSGTGPTIAARFNGWCKGCGKAFDAGAKITHSKDHDGWIAECCA